MSEGTFHSWSSLRKRPWVFALILGFFPAGEISCWARADVLLLSPPQRYNTTIPFPTDFRGLLEAMLQGVNPEDIDPNNGLPKSRFPFDRFQWKGKSGTGQGHELSDEKLEAILEWIKKIGKDKLNGIHPAGQPQSPDGMDLLPDEKLAEWLENFMARVDESPWGDYLRNSPAWQQGLKDLRDWHENTPIRIPVGLDRWVKRWDWRPGLAWGEKQLHRLGQLTPPRLPAIRLPIPRLPGLGLPKMVGPSLPAWPGTNHLQTLGWLLLLMLTAFLTWNWLPRWRGSLAHPMAAPGLGPWPISPRQVATRSQLVQAFDYLALFLLGEPARSWHHRKVAQHLGQEDPALDEAAQRLADLYETARYTQGQEMLDESDRDLARRDLCLLAGL